MGKAATDTVPSPGLGRSSDVAFFYVQSVGRSSPPIPVSVAPVTRDQVRIVGGPYLRDEELLLDQLGYDAQADLSCASPKVCYELLVLTDVLLPANRTGWMPLMEKCPASK